jgi:hypothetical protein
MRVAAPRLRQIPNWKGMLRIYLVKEISPVPGSVPADDCSTFDYRWRAVLRTRRMDACTPVRRLILRITGLQYRNSGVD